MWQKPWVYQLIPLIAFLILSVPLESFPKNPLTENEMADEGLNMRDKHLHKGFRSDPSNTLAFHVN